MSNRERLHLVQSAFPWGIFDHSHTHAHPCEWEHLLTFFAPAPGTFSPKPCPMIFPEVYPSWMERSARHDGFWLLLFPGDVFLLFSSLTPLNGGGALPPSLGLSSRAEMEEGCWQIPTPANAFPLPECCCFCESDRQLPQSGGRGLHFLRVLNIPFLEILWFLIGSYFLTFSKKAH